MRSSKRPSGVLLACILLSTLILPASIARASESSTSQASVRSLSAVAMPGQELAVTVTFTAPTDGFHAIGLIDVAPAGWNVTVDVAWTDPQAMVAHTPKPEEAVYIWAGPYAAGTVFTAVYKVQVPLGAQPGTYTFSGSLEYYVEPYPAPSYKEEVTGDIQVNVVAGVPVRIVGVTREVDGAILPGSVVILCQNGEALANVTSDHNGCYELQFSGLGDYEVMVSKAGFRKEAQHVLVTGPATYRLDFVGDRGLIPNAPTTSYVLACTNLWKFGEPPLQLSLSKALDVISAWKYPILAA